MHRPIGFPVVARNAAVSGLRISAVDGAAFIDACPSWITDLADNGHLIEIYDASNRMLAGVLAAVGTGETLGGELVVNGTFDADTDWTKGTGWSIAGGVAAHTGANGTNIYQTPSKTVGGLYFLSLAVNATSAIVGMYVATNAFYPIALETTTGARTGYGTWPSAAARAGMYAGANAECNVDNASMKQVLTPSATGAVIVSAKGGAVENFKARNANFIYNAASYGVIIKKMR